MARSLSVPAAGDHLSNEETEPISLVLVADAGLERTPCCVELDRLPEGRGCTKAAEIVAVVDGGAAAKGCVEPPEGL